MDAYALGAALLVSVTVIFLVLGLFSGVSAGGGSLARQRLELLKQNPNEMTGPAQGPSMTQRLITPVVSAGTGALGKLLPRSLLKGVEKKLIIAGEPMTMQGFLTLVLVATVASAGFAVLVIVAAGSGLTPMIMGIIVFIAFVGFYLPFWIVNSRARGRQAAIVKSLPDAFDLITTCVEAGLGLDAALARVAEKVQGPFADELSAALRDIALGKARRDALKDLGERTAVPDLMQFTNAVIQAEAMGSSIGTVLRVQAEQLRVRRRQRAEEAAYKAPVKMLFPLVLFIFPTLFIVILGPAAITLMKDFPK
ncbi:MAG TPA: type II secretion system F family protein [Dehalococcoidia bacterium]|jgi:tight adherence protein C|nr:type II secretion system F family protein [Dehalococcoidia bacterium]